MWVHLDHDSGPHLDDPAYASKAALKFPDLYLEVPWWRNRQVSQDITPSK